MKEEDERSVLGGRVVGFENIDRQRIVISGEGNSSGGYYGIHGVLVVESNGVMFEVMMCLNTPQTPRKR